MENEYTEADRLQFEKEIENYHKDLEKYAEQLQCNQERLYRAIKTVKGSRFLKNLKDLLSYIDCPWTGDFELVKYKNGQLQDSDENGLIKKYWVEQFGGSYGCEDCYTGYIYIKLKKTLYLKCNYSC